MARKTKIKSTEVPEMRGSLVWWHFKTSEFDRFNLETHLETLGDRFVQNNRKLKRNATYVDFLPRNDYKACLLRAVRSVIRKSGVVVTDGGAEGEKFYKRISDIKDSCKICIFMPIEIVDGRASATIDIVVELDKKSGELKFNTKSPENETILDEYRTMQRTFSSEQLATVLTKVVQDEAYGVGLKGGVYYVPAHSEDALENLQKIVDFFEGNVRFYRTPIYNDASTKVAIRDAVEEDLMDRIEKVKQQFHEEATSGKMTEKQREGRIAELRDLMARASKYKDDLSSKAHVVQTRLTAIEKQFSKITTFAESVTKRKSALAELWNM